MNNSTAFRIRTFHANTHRQDTTSNIFESLPALSMFRLTYSTGILFFFWQLSPVTSRPHASLPKPSKNFGAQKNSNVFDRCDACLRPEGKHFQLLEQQVNDKYYLQYTEATREDPGSRQTGLAANAALPVVTWYGLSEDRRELSG